MSALSTHPMVSREVHADANRQAVYEFISTLELADIGSARSRFDRLSPMARHLISKNHNRIYAVMMGWDGPLNPTILQEETYKATNRA